MLYLDEFRLPDADDEWRYFRHKNAEYAYDSVYPFQHFPKKQWERIVFDAVTILRRQWLRQKHDAEHHRTKTGPAPEEQLQPQRTV